MNAPRTAHLRAVMTEFVRFHNRERPHRALRLETSVRSPGRRPRRHPRGPSSAGCTTRTRAPRAPRRLPGPPGTWSRRPAGLLGPYNTC